tara:strand:- start:3532 stop:4182 length:651 start_codon:yes stop_codon:yes gene_type:complete
MQIVFDFDGVIINSHKIKTEAFFDVFRCYGKHIGLKAKLFHLNNIGRSRYFKFKFILKNYVKKKINKRELNQLDKNFDDIIKKKLSNLSPSKNLLKFLSKYKETHELYISTGTPQKKIIEILKVKNLIRYFDRVYGSPKTKFEHIKLIKKKKSSLVFIGDSYEDYLVSKKMKVNFVLKYNSENILIRKKIDAKKINSFKNFHKYVEFLEFKNQIKV